MFDRQLHFRFIENWMTITLRFIRSSRCYLSYPYGILSWFFVLLWFLSLFYTILMLFYPLLACWVNENVWNCLKSRKIEYLFAFSGKNEFNGKLQTVIHLMDAKNINKTITINRSYLHRIQFYYFICNNCCQCTYK